ncbi:MAG: helix-turn-helix transcriptional regulator [Erysipelotrichaceae bacterium]|nr:helix-turn-helix transcriptional regulator [Erysipelotrichaceae bacterium]
MDFTQCLGEHLKLVRVERGMTQEELSKKVGIKSYYISRIENGKLDIRLQTLIKLTEGLNIQLSELFSKVEKDL